MERVCCILALPQIGSGFSIAAIILSQMLSNLVLLVNNAVSFSIAAIMLSQMLSNLVLRHAVSFSIAAIMLSQSELAGAFQAICCPLSLSRKPVAHSLESLTKRSQSTSRVGSCTDQACRVGVEGSATGNSG